MSLGNRTTLSIPTSWAEHTERVQQAILKEVPTTRTPRINFFLHTSLFQNLVWEGLLYMCCFYWWMNKAVLGLRRAEQSFPLFRWECLQPLIPWLALWVPSLSPLILLFTLISFETLYFLYEQNCFSEFLLCSLHLCLIVSFYSQSSVLIWCWQHLK